MRGLAAVFQVCVFVPICATGADPAFPYTARISVEEVEVRCGPAWEYYSTTRLRRGDSVEVYRHEPGGWLAIRPPQGSFSWIPSRQVQREADTKVGKVVIDGAVAWVGSTLEDVRQHKWQVRLERDELVEILDEKPWSVGPGFATESYCQIAPPAGEFRWIHAEHALAPQAAAHRTASRTIELTDYAATGSSATHHSVDATGTDAGAKVVGSQGQSALDPAVLAAQLDKLKLDLALLVSRPIAQWDLQPLRGRTEALAASAEGTPLVREVRLIAQRIQECELLLQRHERMLESPAGAADEDPRVERHGVSAAPQVKRTSWQEEIADALDSEQPVGTSVDRLAAELADATFDAEGWLMPVHSTRLAAPPFALLDDDGRVICYVQPSPGLNLRRYTKRHVGLMGNRQYAGELRANLLTATRVVRREK